MTPQQEERADKAILDVLCANNTRFGLSAAAISIYADTGFTPEQTTDRLEYLTQKKLAVEVQKTVHAAARVWKITDEGRRYLDARTS